MLRFCLETDQKVWVGVGWEGEPRGDGSLDFDTLATGGSCYVGLSLVVGHFVLVQNAVINHFARRIIFPSGYDEAVCSVSDY